MKVVDFGIAERMDPERTRASEVAGTLAYMSDLNDWDRARTDGAEALQIRRQIGDRWGEADSLRIAGRLGEQGDRGGDAARLYRDAAALWGALGDLSSAAECLDLIAASIRAADPLRAARFEGAADGLRRSRGTVAVTRPPAVTPELARARADGERMPLDEALALAAISS